MGVAATFIAGLLKRFNWIAYIGLLIILYVAGKMFYDGIVRIWECHQSGTPVLECFVGDTSHLLAGVDQ
jgi:predicted tellurium resistance membrane protein TerC